MDDELYLGRAIEKAREAIGAGQVPVGAAVVRDGIFLVATHNTVWRDCDPTAHAEINAIRYTSCLLQRISLSGCTVYATLEPCPMCMSALLWTQVKRVVFGVSIGDAVRLGFPELWVPAQELAARARMPVQVEQCRPLRDACLELFHQWHAAGSPRVKGNVRRAA